MDVSVGELFLTSARSVGKQTNKQTPDMSMCCYLRLLSRAAHIILVKMLVKRKLIHNVSLNIPVKEILVCAFGNCGKVSLMINKGCT